MDVWTLELCPRSTPGAYEKGPALYDSQMNGSSDAIAVRKQPKSLLNCPIALPHGVGLVGGGVGVGSSVPARHVLSLPPESTQRDGRFLSIRQIVQREGKGHVNIFTFSAICHASD